MVKSISAAKVRKCGENGSAPPAAMLRLLGRYPPLAGVVVRPGVEVIMLVTSTPALQAPPPAGDSHPTRHPLPIAHCLLIAFIAFLTFLPFTLPPFYLSPFLPLCLYPVKKNNSPTPFFLSKFSFTFALAS
jgi:hypothetical protein